MLAQQNQLGPVFLGLAPEFGQQLIGWRATGAALGGK